MFLAPFTPDADDAQRLAQDELAKGMYADSPTLMERFLNWLAETLMRIGLEISPGSGGAGSYLIILLIVLVIVAVIFFAVRRSRIGAVGAGRTSRTELFDDLRSSRQLFAAADKAERSGDLNLAVIELYRAIIRLLDERGLITVVPGMTALEAAKAGATRLEAEDLFSRCAVTFNEVYYWHGQAGRDDVRALHDLRRKIEPVQVSA